MDFASPPRRVLLYCPCTSEALPLTPPKTGAGIGSYRIMSLSKIGRYQIQAELGRGAMGIVYRGFDPNIGRTVAIKAILLDTGDPQAIQRLQREAQAAGILSHPNIVTVYDAGEDNGLFYIAMELVVGDTLQQVMASGPIPVEQAIPIVAQVGAALDYAHTRQIIHRDVKPANIMVSEGRVKVMDFGIAKIIGSGMTTTGEILGTPAYMSPELVKGLTLDGSSDLFSLGAMFYQMVTGVKPFTGDSITTLLYKILQEDPPPPSAVNRSLPPGLDYPVLKTLAKEPAARYPNCAQFLADLKNYPAVSGAVPLSGPSLEAMVVDREQLAREQATQLETGLLQWARERKSLLAVAAGVLLALAGVIWQLNRPPMPNPETPPERTVAPAPAPAPEPPATPPARQAVPPPASPPARSQTPPPAPTPRAQPALTTPTRPWLTVPGEAGRVAVHTEPQGARIFINGEETPYRSPVNFAVVPGRYQITVERSGYASETREVVVRKDQMAPVQLELNRKQD